MALTEKSPMSRQAGHGSRDGLGAGLFLELLTADPFGPRFPIDLVERADRYELLASPVSDWPEGGEWREFRLYEGDRLIAERRLTRVRGDLAQVIDTPLP